MSQGAIALVVALITAIVLMTGSRDPAASQTSEEAKVLRVAEAGKMAVLRDRPTDLCRLLTPRARRNSRKSFHYEGTRGSAAPSPLT